MDAFDWSPFLAGVDEAPETVHRRWHAAGLVDGLPMVTPTITRVRALYRGAGMDPARHLAVLEPSLRPVSVYDTAACAVAAGCVAAHLPVLTAAVRAVADPGFNLLGVQTTTGTAAPAIIVHGAAARAAGVSGGADCLAGSAVANAAIGRALRLVLRSVGGAATGGMDAATMGQPAKLSLCFAENVDASPWPAMHSDAGFPADAGAVTVVAVSGSVEIVHAEDAEPHSILAMVAGSMLALGNVGSDGLIGGGSPLVVLSPEHASALARGGLRRAGVQQALWDRAVLAIDQLPEGQARRVRRALGAADTAAVLRVADTPRDVVVAVAGGVGAKSTYLASWSGGTRAVTVAVV